MQTQENGTTNGTTNGAAKRRAKSPEDRGGDNDGLSLGEVKAEARVTGDVASGRANVEVKIVIPPITLSEIVVPVLCETPLIMHKFSDKSKRQMAEKQQSVKGAAKKAKDPKDPNADFLGAIYYIGDKPVLGKGEEGRTTASGEFGIPAISLKKAMVGACRHVDGLPMTLARTLFHVMADVEQPYPPSETVQLIRLEAETDPWMREDTVRLESGVADLRYRPQFDHWRLNVRVRFNPRLIDAASIVNLVNVAGQGGIGENRPEKSGGTNGMFRVDASRAANVIR